MNSNKKSRGKPYAVVTIHFKDAEAYERVKKAAQRVGVSPSAFITGEATAKADEVLAVRRCKECGRLHAA